jgi:uncharacterized membrane protein YkgB
VDVSKAIAFLKLEIGGATGVLRMADPGSTESLASAFGVRGAGYFLRTTETIFGCLILLGYWSPRFGILGALGSIVTFVGTTSIIPFLHDG